MEYLKILIVDDEKYDGILIAKCVDWESRGFRIAGLARTSREAMEMFSALSPDIVFCDINMPVIDGLELGRRMKALRPEVRIVIVTGYPEFGYAREAIRLGVDDYILKPVQPDELLAAAERIKTALAVPAQGRAIRNDMVRRAVDCIEERLAVKGLSLRTIAAELYVNGSYLSRVFKDETGESVTEYIMRRRIEKSIELFNTTDLRVYEAAARVGMPDAHYFGQCFKKHVGVTVNEYRKNLRAGKH